jgi:FkbM family methyltransferase
MASRLVIAARQLVGRPAEAEFVRHGIRWRLDLREGIDLSIFLLGAFELETVRAYSTIVKPGATVLDIGANIGAHTLPLAALVGERGRVVSFEPTAFAFRKCATNVALNPGLGSRITMLQAMLVASERDALPSAVFSSWPLVDSQDLHEKHRGRMMDTKGACVSTLDRIVDDLRLDRIDFIKLDVDGYEYPVLAGGVNSLRRFRPTIALELAPYIHSEHGYTFEELIAVLSFAGYCFSDMATGKSIPSDARTLRRAIPDGGSMNVLARCKGDACTSG